jgi:hypothetical protein
MKLRQNNLFVNGATVSFDNGEGLLLREQLTIPPHPKDIYHTIKQGDRLDLIAWSYYEGQVEDSSKYWWVIADRNNILITNPLDLDPLIGIEIVIPPINIVINDL